MTYRFDTASLAFSQNFNAPIAHWGREDGMAKEDSNEQELGNHGGSWKYAVIEN